MDWNRSNSALILKRYHYKLEKKKKKAAKPLHIKREIKVKVSAEQAENFLREKERGI